MKVDLDARTLEAMRVLTARYNAGDPDKARDVLRAFLAAHDSARDAERDEALAVAMHETYRASAGSHVGWDGLSAVQKSNYVAVARAARDFIAKEQS